jgi:putative chaperone protein DnaJ
LKINFAELRKQNLDNETFINILEAIYYEIINNDLTKVRLNELSSVEIINIDEFSFELSNAPSSINDILIISRKEQFIITPDSIYEIKDKKVFIKDNRLKNKDEIFVTYKY